MATQIMEVQCDMLKDISATLTNYGKIISIDSEGTIEYQLTADTEDDFTLGELAALVRSELISYFSGLTMTRKEKNP